jgi:HPt (histidine-containing phosphotransfer) domain-containing protein/HAMP domain-containing protein
MSRSVGRGDASRGGFVSIGSRLVAATTLLLAVVALAVYVGLSRHERATLLRAKDTAAEMVVSLFAANARAAVVFDDRSAVDEGVSRLAQNPDVTFAAIYAVDAAGRPAPEPMGSLRRGNLPQAEDVASLPRAIRVRRAPDSIVVVAPIPGADGAKPAGLVCVIFTLAGENAAIAAMEREILRDSFGLAFLTAVLLVVFARRAIVQPLGRLADAAKHLERGERVDLDVESADEIGVLASAFRAMSEAIALRETKITARNADMRLVLDNLEQGLMTLQRDGDMSEERSASVDRWFGPPRAGVSVWSYLAAVDEGVGELLRVSWDALTDGFMPLEVCLHQMPRRMRKGGHTYELAWRPVMVDGDWSKLVLVISDVTDRLEAERAEEAQRETVAMFQRILRDPKGFSSFYDECAQLVVASRDSGAALVAVKRAIHTLKGNCGLFGIASVARVCHGIEARIEESPSPLHPQEVRALSDVWGAVERTYETIGRLGRAHVILEVSEYEGLLDAIRGGADAKTLATIVESFRSEPVTVSFGRFTERAQALAAKLGRAPVRVVVEPSRVRLPPSRFAPFWCAFAHVIRNAVDHGIETTDERAAARKPPRATLRLRASAAADGVSLVAEDDGRGIDWAAVATKARAANLPATTRDDLVEALCADDFTTRASATETSGRGLGLGAVREVVRAMGGRMRIESELGSGAKFHFTFPASCVEER